MTGAIGRMGLILATAGLVAGCQNEGGFFKKKSATEAPPAAAAAAPSRSVKLVDHDVEAPEVFQVSDTALWDGRPSLGGVWVASPDAKDPERVILRNTANGKFVIGALFRRERDNPGPKLQISSDAAGALGVLAGQPVKISVTALRRQETPEAAPDASKPILDAAETVEAKPLDTAAVATAALDRADGKKAATPAAPKPAVNAPAAAKPAAPAPAKAASGGLIQIGIFSVEENAKRAADKLAKAGVPADTRKGEAQGKAFWQVTARGGADTLAKAKTAGFADAYVLKR
ncbi:MAG: SPOR domain-containing protein [Paracoccaceae bacterium]